MLQALRTLVRCAVVVGGVGASSVGHAVAAVDFGAETVSSDARNAVDRIVRSGDNHGLPFAIVDKKAARLFVFDGEFRLAGASTVLLGRARGDDAVPGPISRRIAALNPGARTTPAGRFASEPGHNDRGEPIVWIDYDASLAIHRLRPAPPRERRPQRLASARVDDKRISLGCVVAPVAFYEGVVAPLLGKRRGVVYILPESRPVETLFDAAEQLALR